MWALGPSFGYPGAPGFERDDWISKIMTTPYIDRSRPFVQPRNSPPAYEAGGSRICLDSLCINIILPLGLRLAYSPMTCDVVSLEPLLTKGWAQDVSAMVRCSLSWTPCSAGVFIELNIHNQSLMDHTSPGRGWWETATSDSHSKIILPSSPEKSSSHRLVLTVWCG